MASILWEWDVPDTGAPDSYNLYTGTVSGQETLRQAGITTTSFSDTNINVSDPHYGYAKAVYNGVETNASNEGTVGAKHPPRNFRGTLG